MDDVLELITETITKDDYGVDHATRTARQVFCKKKSAGRNEFFEGGRNGLNPEYVFTVFRGDYSGERLCRFGSASYAIYRTYETDGDYIELYAQREGGANGI